MKIFQLSSGQLTRRLKKTGLRWRIGPFIVHLRSGIASFIDYFQRMYGHHPFLEPPWNEIADFHIDLVQDRGPRRWWRPKVYFELDGSKVLAPFPLDHAPPLFEWGLNFCIAGRSNHLLILHAAVVARDGRAMILPGTPGSGKSTLCAALMLRGWQLLSDEFALIRPEDGHVLPLPKPIALKNQSLEVIRRFESAASLGPVFPKTRKGTVAHLPPTAGSVAVQDRALKPEWLVFPRYEADSAPVLLRPPPQYTFLRLAANAFNYEVRGASGFRSVARLVRGCHLYEFRNGGLEKGVAVLEGLLERRS